jgi:phosphoglycolate phosphatase-like HAD superfamily hydrolase
MKAVLFDIDGTLMIGHGAGTRAMTRAGRAVCGEAFDLAGIMIGGGLDPVIFHEAALGMGVVDPFALHDAFRDRYLEELQAELIAAEQQPHVLPGVLNLLEQLAERDDVAIGLVTGNYQRAVPIKFKHVGLQPHGFVAGGFGDDARTRPGLVPIALQRLQSVLGVSIAAQDAIVVGDTPRDVDCALQNGCRCLAVATGGHSLAELQQAGAQRAVSDLSDPDVLLSWL